jgi:hypothetical protein
MDRNHLGSSVENAMSNIEANVNNQPSGIQHAARLTAVLAASRIRGESQLEFEIIGSFNGYSLSWSNSEMRLLSISRMTEWVRRAVRRLWSKLDLRSSGSELAGLLTCLSFGQNLILAAGPMNADPGADHGCDCPLDNLRSRVPPMCPSSALSSGKGRNEKEQGGQRVHNQNKAIGDNRSSCKGFSIASRGFESRPGLDSSSGR